MNSPAGVPAAIDSPGAGDVAEATVCCTRYQSAVELVGRRWTGAIISVLLAEPRRFSEISCAVPDLSDRLLSARLRELEDCGILERIACDERPSRYRYGLTDMGRDLSPALDEIRAWAERWLDDPRG